MTTGTSAPGGSSRLVRALLGGSSKVRATVSDGVRRTVPYARRPRTTTGGPRSTAPSGRTV
ncbi:hypothetical protein [Streptomyces sp. NPDC005009]